ncbi:MAG: Dihydrolipoyl dehydrogenase [Candidatus Methanofastidiosum methylothiophilum]|uniref:Dihydrolipoyl dehydrogenase n=1 Tax=Candidatus Methanofastidiosum methylothiophilum TaxID=1705564 RepID=A0A150J002_9EURY|nr:MAG: Dihydrolipoyl dehydrogenase [Candidatus Methanofastidiosum methylthiophilus]KYC47938.1 MAG: Dihydrolipoyl dehydrogenase [Candidatus Methanofastidiosum methylthiophilus]KYC50556.1 MAG: Dihydrolipoyl dehydrogenase [Candidatus Methanofastidiosum methylthiophilus]
MKKYDVLVIGSGAGMGVASDALSNGFKVAVVDKGPLGGTCLNLGCIPSKLIIFPADRVSEIENSKKLGVEANITKIRFKEIMERMRSSIAEDREQMREGIKQAKNLDFYDGAGYFVDDYTMEVNGKKIIGEKIFIAAGARPLIPNVTGIDKVDYLTNESILELNELPKSVVILGGGYIACEFGHFLSGMGSEVTIIQRNVRLVANEEPEVSDLLLKEMSKRMKIYTATEVIELAKEGSLVKVIGKDRNTNKTIEVSAEKLLIAGGRLPNSDLLKVENTGVKTDSRGFIIVDEFLQTSKENIWAFGDVIGKYMFRHSANKEAVYAWHNSLHEKKVPMDYTAIPHAVFSYPEIASVGMTESEAKKKYKVLVGHAKYNSVAKGIAMLEEDSFAKAIVDKETNKILGFHIIGPYASILIQEVINVMANNLDRRAIFKGIHIHPALSELIPSTLGNLVEPKD